MKFTAYSKSTGEVLFRGDADNPESLENETISVLVGKRYEEDGWISNKVFHKLPVKPSPIHVFNYSSKLWEDCRSTQEKWEEVKFKRNKLLESSDWTQLPDVPLSTKNAWAIYRQALRDITKQSDPLNIVWPQEP